MAAHRFEIAGEYLEGDSLCLQHQRQADYTQLWEDSPSDTQERLVVAAKALESLVRSATITPTTIQVDNTDRLIQYYEYDKDKGDTYEIRRFVRYSGSSPYYKNAFVVGEQFFMELPHVSDSHVLFQKELTFTKYFNLFQKHNDSYSLVQSREYNPNPNANQSFEPLDGIARHDDLAIREYDARDFFLEIDNIGQLVRST